MRPGSAPTYVRRCPRISASSWMPPNEMRTNFRPSARAMDSPSDVLPTPGGPTSVMIAPDLRPVTGPRPRSSRSFMTARNSMMRSFTSSNPVWSASSTERACDRSNSSSLRALQGSSTIQSSHVRIQPCSGDCSDVRSRRSTSRSNSLRASSGSPASSALRRYSATTSSPPSFNSFLIASSCCRSMYSRCWSSMRSVTSRRILSFNVTSASVARYHSSSLVRRASTSVVSSTSTFCSNVRSGE